MKRLLCGTLLLLGSVTEASFATPITYEFSGALTRVSGSGEVLADFSVGSPFSVQLTYDASGAVADPTVPNLFTNVFSYTAQIGSAHIVGSSGSLAFVQLFDSPVSPGGDPDVLSFFDELPGLTSGFGGDATLENFGLDFSDSTATQLDAGLPSLFDPFAFDLATMSLFWQRSPLEFVSLRGSLTPQRIPEPGTLALFAASLGLLFTYRRLRSKRRTTRGML